MKNKKPLILILLIGIFLLSAINVSNVAATTDDTVVTFYDFSHNSGTTDGYALVAAFPGGTESAEYETFNASYSAYLTSVTFAFSKGASPNTNIEARIYGCGDSLSNPPNGTILATSTNKFNSTTFPTTATGSVQCRFDFDGTYQLLANTKYIVAVIPVDTVTLDNTNKVWVIGDASGATYDGGYGSYATSWQGPYGGMDICFYVRGSASDPNYEATPTPLVTPFDTSGDGFYGGITWYIVAILIILLPAGLMYYVKLRSLGFMLTGLAIGSGLGYLLMPQIVPLWLLVVIIIGLVVSFFKDSLIPTGGSTEGAAE